MHRVAVTSCSVWMLVAMLLPVSTRGAQLPEDPPRTVTAREVLTESQDDHVEAVALYAHGRILLHQGLQRDGVERDAQLANALRRFQRAWWFDHDLVTIIDEVVPLAYRLDRPDEAMRYAVLAVEHQDVSADLAERVAAVLAQQEQFARALALYRKSATARQGPLNIVTQFELGRLALLVGQFDQSASAFAAVRDALDGQGGEAVSRADRRQILRKPELTYALFGESFVRAKRLDEAESAFRAADKAKPNRALLGLRLALIEKQRGNRSKALAELDKYFASKSINGGMSPYVLLAELIDGPAKDDTAGQEAGAARIPSDTMLDRLRQLADSDPSNALLGYFLADRLRQAEKFEEAAAQYKRMLEQDPALDGHQGLIDIYLHQQRLDQVVKQIGAVVRQTGSLESLRSRADQVVEDPQMRDHLVALIKDQRAHPDSERPSGTVMAMALLAAMAEQPALATKCFDQALEQPGPTAGPFAVNFAFELLQLDRPADAASVFQRILDEKLLPEKRAEVYYYLAGAWTLAKETAKALDAAREAARLEPGSARMIARASWILYQAKRLEEAEQGYLTLLDRFDSDHGSSENRDAMRDARLILSAINVQRDRIETAEQWLQQVIDEFPEDIGAFNDLGYLWSDQGKHLSRSLVMIKKAVAAEPDNIAYRDSLGWALFQLGRYPEAVVELRKAAEGDAVDGVILDHLGDACAKAGYQQQALEAWKKAENAFKQQNDTKLLEEIREKIKLRASR